MNAKKQMISIRLNDEQKERIQLFCQLNDITLSELVRLYFFQLLENDTKNLAQSELN